MLTCLSAAAVSWCPAAQATVSGWYVSFLLPLRVPSALLLPLLSLHQLLLKFCRLSVYGLYVLLVSAV